MIKIVSNHQSTTNIYTHHFILEYDPLILFVYEVSITSSYSSLRIIVVILFILYHFTL